MLLSPTAVRMRGWLRQHPLLHRTLLRVSSGMRRKDRWQYEGRYAATACSVIRPDDCVWDVGANVGIYTRRFLEQLGPAGTVVAFDPSPTCCEIVNRIGDPRLQVEELAIADSDGTAPFSMKGGSSSEDSHLGEGALTVRVARVDSLVQSGLPQPTVIKVDVEGFEGEVIDGLGLVWQSLHALLFEVHFRLLDERGKPNEPLRLVNACRSRGFNVRWVDWSHFIATR